MGKASRWFRGLLGFKITANADQSKAAPPPPPLTAKKKWSIVRRDRQKPHHESAGDSDADASRHAIVVAEATAAAAEAAVAAAQAAAAVVQLTSSGRNISAPGGGADASRGAACVSRSGGGFRSREEWAAVTIQSHFRGYLARRALRALKGLVKLQALVKGHLVRKQTAYTLKRLQALVRAQVRARAGRVLISESPMKSAQFNYAGPATPEKFEHHDVIRARSMKHQQVMMLKRKGSKSSGSVNYDSEKPRTNSAWTGERLSEQGCLTRTLHTDDDRTDKILEVDPGNPHAISKRRPLFYSSHLSLSSDQNCQSISTSKESTAHCQSVLSSSEVQSVSPMKLTQDADESTFCTADNSPTFYSSSSRGGSAKQGAFTPAKSDGSRSCLSGYSDHPNYMSYTESSKAKARSHSAPKQRPQYDRSGSTKRYSVHTHSGDSTRPIQKSSSLQPNFSNRPYPGSGLLDRLGMPVRGNNDGFSGGHWHQY